MSKMSEKHYEESQQQQEDCPSIEDHMKYPIIFKFTPNIYNWFEKYFIGQLMANYREPKYVKAQKVEDIF